MDYFAYGLLPDLSYSGTRYSGPPYRPIWKKDFGLTALAVALLLLAVVNIRNAWDSDVLPWRTAGIARRTLNQFKSERCKSDT